MARSIRHAAPGTSGATPAMVTIAKADRRLALRLADAAEADAGLAEAIELGLARR